MLRYSDFLEDFTRELGVLGCLEKLVCKLEQFDDAKYDRLEGYLSKLNQESRVVKASQFLKKVLSDLDVVRNVENIESIEKVIIYLLNKGAKLPSPNFFENELVKIIMLHLYSVIKHPEFLRAFSEMSHQEQCSLLITPLLMIKVPPIEPEKHLTTLEILTPYVKHAPRDNNSCPCPAQKLVKDLQSYGSIHSEETLPTMFKIFGLLIKHNCYHDLEYYVTPNSHQLWFTNPATNEPYDLYQFILDYHELYDGFRKLIRDYQLLNQYALTKAILQTESRTKDQLNSDIAPGDFDVTSKDGINYSYNDYRVKELGQDRILANILQWMDEGDDLPEEARLQKAHKLIDVAKRNLK